jgi:uncharacterized protein (DUF2062 family)
MPNSEESRSARRSLSSFAASLGSGLAIALMPKCPLCIAAALSSLGASAALSGVVAPFVRPLVMGLGALAALAFAMGLLPALLRRWSSFQLQRRKRRFRRSSRLGHDGLSCCGHRS